MTREAGPAWIDPKGIFEQLGVNDHAAFMNRLAEEGVVLFAGPLAGSEVGRVRALVIMDVDSDAEIPGLLADDPWTKSNHLVISRLEPWNVFVGADRLRAAAKPS